MRPNTELPITIQLPEEQEAALKAKASARGMATEEYARQILDQDLKAADAPRRHIPERIRELMSDVPAADFEQFSAGAASEIDRYLYGSPQRNQ